MAIFAACCGRAFIVYYIIYYFIFTFISLIIIRIYLKNINNTVNAKSIWYDFLNTNRNNNSSKILYYPFIGCGYANKIPTLLSSLLLSAVSFHPIFIVNWKELLFYFHFPRSFFVKHNKLWNAKIYDRKNSTVLSLLKTNINIKIYTYHSYTYYVLHFYNLTSNIITLIKRKEKKNVTLEMLLHQIFLRPTKSITNYINIFRKKKNSHYIVGVHIRTGYLSDFGEKDRRFFNNNSILLYIKRINQIINKHKDSMLFIISDSTVIKHNVSAIYQNQLFNYTIPGKICHARGAMHGKIELNECVVKLIAENYILSECNVIIGNWKSTYFEMACKRKVVQCIKV